MIISAALFGCSGGPQCGPEGASAFGLVATGSGVSLTYGAFVAGANNDCPDPSAPAGVVSLTITGMQMGGTGLVTLCVPRPDELAKGSVALGSGVEVIDFTGADASCTYALAAAPAPAPSGTATSAGLCDNGSNAAGFGLELAGTLTLDRTCGSGSGSAADTVAVTLAGDTAIGDGVH